MAALRGKTQNQRRLDMRHQSSRDHGKNNAKLNFVIFEVQSGANSAPSNSGRISGQKKLLRAGQKS